MPVALRIAGQQRIAVYAAGGRYEEVVKLQETLCVLKAQFQELQLTDVGQDQTQQRALYNKAQKVCYQHSLVWLLSTHDVETTAGRTT